MALTVFAALIGSCIMTRGLYILANLADEERNNTEETETRSNRTDHS
jgi:hypothetical protein